MDLWVQLPSSPQINYYTMENKKKPISLVVTEALAEIIKNVDAEVTYSIQHTEPDFFSKKSKQKETFINIKIKES